MSGGAGPHPALPLLHGFPGNEQDLDLAQGARRAGWLVLTLHYRGSGGSPGDFGFGHCIEDAQTALDRLRSNATRDGIDPRRIVVGGHGMGGFVAVESAEGKPNLAGFALIGAWNIGKAARGMADHAAAEAQLAPNLPLAGASATALVDEAVAHRDACEPTAAAPALARNPLFVAGTARGISAALAAQVDTLTLPTALGRIR